MERLLIILAVLVGLTACVAVMRMSARGRRPPLQLGRELDVDDEALLIGTVGPRPSPIDRSAQVLDAHALDAHAPDAQIPDAKRSEREPPDDAPTEPPRSRTPDAPR